MSPLPGGVREGAPRNDYGLIENIVDKLEGCAREGEAPDWEDIEGAAECLIHDLPYAGFGST